MTFKCLAGLSMAFVLIGCSKQEEASSTPAAKVASMEPTTPKPAPAAPPPAPASTPAAAVSASEPSTLKTAPPIPKTESAPTLAIAESKTTATAASQNSSAGQKALDLLNRVTAPPAKSATPQSSAPASAASLVPNSLADIPTDQVTQGLKEALGNGLKHAISTLGKSGGFLTNLNVRIPIPDKLKTVEKTMRSLGQDRIADEFITTMNQAAEQAVPAAADVFATSLKAMSVEDARKILSGPKDSATQFFRSKTEAELTQKFLPIVQQATAKSGATASYKQVMDKARIAGPFLTPASIDLDSYVTDRALNGLFKMVADEEKRIRENPVARSTDLLKSVFGALEKQVGR